MAKACCWLVLLTLLVFNGKELLVEGREIDQIEHVVIFMQENRAFDHYFGTLSGVRGFNDRAAPFLPSGLPVWYQPVAPDQESNAKQGGGNNNNNNNNNSYILPFHVDSQRTSATCMDAPAMGWSPDIEMYNSGLNDAWNTARDPGYGMGYFERSDLPYYYALADAFSISDQYFQSVFSSTNPNRLFFFSGCCGLSAGYPPATDNTEPVPGFQWETIAQVFETQNISWRVYQQVDHFDDNGFAWFEVFQKAVPGTPLYDKGKQPVPNIVTAFDQDMTAGALPQVSIIIAPEALSEHANNHPAAGEDLSARLIAALASHPDVYAKTVFILNYDEGGQFFDHHWPPTPPMNSSEGLSTVDVTDELVNGIKTVGPSTPYGPLGMGWRVPLIVVSPWTRGGWVNSQVSDHTSVLRFLEHRFNITFSTISEWRRTVAGDLLSFFNFSNPDYSWPTLPNTNGYVEAADRQCSTLPMPVIPTDQSLPTQETGVRPSHTLPYQLYVADALLKDPTGLGSQLGLTIINAGQAGAAFQVYDLNQASNAPRKYTVSAGLNLTDSWQLSAASYNLSLHGPNGFVRMLWGQVPASLAYPCWCQQLAYDLIDGNLMLLLQAASDSPAACTFTITPNAYLSSGPMPVTVSPGSQSIFNVSVASSGNWYDVTVQADAYHYGRRYMGRIERPGCTSDPAASSPEPVLLFPSFSHPTSHPPIPAHVRKFRDLSAIPTHKDQRCFEAEYEPFYEHVCASPIRH